jgi:hypothetical protein
MTVPEQADVFRGLAPLLRVRRELEQIYRFGAQWASEQEPEAGGWAPFHIVTFGACLLEVGARAGIVLKAGDAAVQSSWRTAYGPGASWRHGTDLDPTRSPALARRADREDQH